MPSPADNKVSLGCGTLILIALIVMIFSRGSDNSRLSNEIQRLRNEIRNPAGRSGTSNPSLEQKLDTLQQSVDSLKRSIDTQSAEIGKMNSEIQKVRAEENPPSGSPPVESE